MLEDLWVDHDDRANVQYNVHNHLRWGITTPSEALTPQQKICYAMVGPLNSSFHNFIFHYPNISTIQYSSFHFLFRIPTYPQYIHVGGLWLQGLVVIIDGRGFSCCCTEQRHSTARLLESHLSRDCRNDVMSAWLVTHRTQANPVHQRYLHWAQRLLQQCCLHWDRWIPIHPFKLPLNPKQ